MTHVLDMLASMECTSLLAQTESLLLGIDWDSLLRPKEFTAGATYFWLAIVSSTLFVLRILLMVFGGDFGGDVDVDIDAGGAADALDAADSFTMLSLLSILAFCMGTGWGGLTALYQFDLGATPSFFIAVAIGMSFMFLASSMMFYMRKLDSTPTSDASTALGKTGKVYMSIPAKGDGRGQVEIVVSGKKKIMDASSDGEKIEAFRSVRVTAVRDDGSLLVEQVD